MTNDSSVKENPALVEARVLVVDDNPSDRLLIKTILIKLGIKNLQEAENVKSAAFKLQTAFDVAKPFDLVILDWNMPGKSGFEFLKEIRGQKDTNKTPVIMVTSVTEADKIRDSLRMGVDDFVIKPVQIALLADKVNKLLMSFKKA